LPGEEIVRNRQLDSLLEIRDERLYLAESPTWAKWVEENCNVGLRYLCKLLNERRRQKERDLIYETTGEVCSAL
jgi:hypothetical protein